MYVEQTVHGTKKKSIGNHADRHTYISMHSTEVRVATAYKCFNVLVVLDKQTRNISHLPNPNSNMFLKKSWLDNSSIEV